MQIIQIVGGVIIYFVAYIFIVAAIYGMEGENYDKRMYCMVSSFILTLLLFLSYKLMGL